MGLRSAARPENPLFHVPVKAIAALLLNKCTGLKIFIDLPPAVFYTPRQAPGRSRAKKNLLAKHWLKNSLLYRELKAEHDEILRHKWFVSEKAGYDVGFDVAVIDWKLKHFSDWRRERQRKQLSLAAQEI